MDKINKKRIIIISLVLIALIGVAYAWFSYIQEGSNRQLIGSNVYLTLTDNEESINLTNAYPESATEARTNHNTNDATNNTMTFTIEGENETNKDIYFEIVLNEGDEVANKIRFKPYHLVFDLIEITEVNNNPVETYLVSAMSYPTLNRQRIYADKVDANSTVDRTFKVRMWLSEDMLVSDTNSNADYKETGTYALSNHFGSVKVGVLADMKEKNNPEGLYAKIKNLVEPDNPPSGFTAANYIGKYSDLEGDNDSQDTVGTNSSKQEIYYYTGETAKAHSNVLFAGYCWQIVRTTDNGGVKLLFNGKAENNQCKTNRPIEKVVSGAAGSQNRGTGVALNGQYVYGKSYSYDLNTNTFTLEDTFEATWSDSTYQNLVGTYTCKNANPCTTLYYVGHYQDSTHASTASYTIGTTGIQGINGTSAYNAYFDSPALVGYMYNDTFLYKAREVSTELKEGLYGANVHYENGHYVLESAINVTKREGETAETFDESHHYTCDDENCEKVRFYYRRYTETTGQEPNQVTTIYYYYTVFEKGMTVEEAVNLMTNNENINKNNSAMKGYLDNWYKHNLINYTGFLDPETVYCSNRTIYTIGGWVTSGDVDDYMRFKQNSNNYDMRCANITDRFSVNNAKAKLTYPIGLLTEPERKMMDNGYATLGQNQWWWLASPYRFGNGNAVVRYVGADGSYNARDTNGAGDVRAVVSLKPGIEISDGDGSYEAPYVVNYTN